MKKLFIYITLFCFVSFVFASTVIFKEFNAIPDTSNRVTISWVTKDEAKVKSFRIKRSNDNQSTFTELAKINSKGPGYNYLYVDNNVFFKTGGVVHYKIEAIDKNGNSIEVTPLGGLMVHPNITGIFKTWGAIKKIFR